jgi:Flp pilus assembly protein TadG
MSELDSRVNNNRRTLRFRDENGQTMIMLTIAFGTMIALLGLVFDGGRLYYEKRRLQAAADAGAFAAVQELRRGHRNAELQVKPAARRDVELNGYTASNATINVSYPNGGNANQVVVTVQSVVPTTFMRIVSRTSSTVGARAVGAILLGGDPCVVALRNDNSSSTLRTVGGASLNAQCGLYVNAGGGSAMVSGGSSSISATWAGVVGGHSNGAGNYNVTNGIQSDTTGFDMPEIPDPLAAIIEPSTGSLPSWNVKGYCNPSGGPVAGSGANACDPIYFRPGTYRNRIQLTGSGTAIFMPGLYNLESGITINGSWNVSGNGVTWLLNGGGLASKGLDIRSDGLLNLTAPDSTQVMATGGVQGILFFGSRNNSYTNNGNQVGRAQAGSVLSGAVYFPNEHIDWAGNSDTLIDGTASADIFSMVVAETIDITGSGDLAVMRKPSSQGSSPTIYRAALVE